jgi:hypothetical protein
MTYPTVTCRMIAIGVSADMARQYMLPVQVPWVRRGQGTRVGSFNARLVSSRSRLGTQVWPRRTMKPGLGQVARPVQPKERAGSIR